MNPIVALDTNALMMPIEANIRVFDELDRLLGVPQGGTGSSSSAEQRSADHSSGRSPREDDGQSRAGYELVTLRGVVEELESLAESGSGTEATAASVGADLAERCRVIEHETDHVDDALVELATQRRFDYVVTNDSPLRKRLLDARVPVIHLRGQHKLTLTQP